MTDPMPAVRSILGMPGSELPPVPSRTVLFAETHNVLVDIATQLRIANLQIERTYLQNELRGDHNNHPKLLRLMKVDGQIQNGLGLREPEL